MKIQFAILLFTFVACASCLAAEECDSRLTRDFASFIEKALEREIITLEDAEALAKADRPFNPKQSETARPALSNYIRIFNSHLNMDQATWEIERSKIAGVVAKRRGTVAIRDEAVEATSRVLGIEPLNSTPATGETAVESFKTADGRIVVLTRETFKTDYHVRDPLVNAPLTTLNNIGRDQIPALGLDQAGQPLLHVLKKTNFEELTLFSTNMSGGEVDRKTLKRLRLEDARLEADIDGIVMAFFNRSRILGWKTGGEPVVFHEASGMEFVRAYPGAGRHKIIELKKFMGPTYFVQFDGERWRFLPHAPFEGHMTPIQMRDGRFAVARLNRGGDGGGEIEFAGNPPIPFKGLEGHFKKFGLFEGEDGRLFFWGVKMLSGSGIVIGSGGAGPKFALEIFEPAHSPNPLRTYPGYDDCQVEPFYRGNQLYFAVTYRNHVEVAAAFHEENMEIGYGSFDTKFGMQRIFPLAHGEPYYLGVGETINLNKMLTNPK